MRKRQQRIAAGCFLLALGAFASRPSAAPRSARQSDNSDAAEIGSPDFARMQREQAATDREWRQAGRGHMRMAKITYPAKKGTLLIPAFVFQPLDPQPAKSEPALVWVH